MPNAAVLFSYIQWGSLAPGCLCVKCMWLPWESFLWRFWHLAWSLEFVFPIFATALKSIVHSSFCIRKCYWVLEKLGWEQLKNLFTHSTGGSISPMPIYWLCPFTDYAYFNYAHLLTISLEVSCTWVEHVFSRYYKMHQPLVHSLVHLVGNRNIV